MISAVIIGSSIGATANDDPRALTTYELTPNPNLINPVQSEQFCRGRPCACPEILGSTNQDFVLDKFSRNKALHRGL